MIEKASWLNEAQASQGQAAVAHFCAARPELFERQDKKWGCSSAGRAPALQAGGQRFDPAQLHHFGGLSG